MKKRKSTHKPSNKIPNGWRKECKIHKSSKTKIVRSHPKKKTRCLDKGGRGLPLINHLIKNLMDGEEIIKYVKTQRKRQFGYIKKREQDALIKEKEEEYS